MKPPLKKRQGKRRLAPKRGQPLIPVLPPKMVASFLSKPENRFMIGMGKLLVDFISDKAAELIPAALKAQKSRAKRR